MTSRRLLFSFFVPTGAVVFVLVAALRFGAAPLTLPLARWGVGAAIGGSALLALRFNSSRALVALAMLAAAAAAMSLPEFANSAALVVVATLLPMNFALLALTRERGLRDSRLLLWAGILFVETVVVGIAAQSGAATSGVWIAPGGWTRVPAIALAAYVLAALVIVGRFVYVQRSMESGWFWSMLATALAFDAAGARSAAMLATAAAAIGVALIESSYFMAFHDELTTLPSRRAFNQELDALGEAFTIAIVDVDHFKQFNDTYGHETGDQVLRLVASRLGHVGGGGRSFRTGGEEFAVVFRDCGLTEAIPFLEELRLEISETVFTIRRNDRPRRTSEERRAQRTRGERDVAITVSLGAAQAGARFGSPEAVVRAADEALYRAKENGRNRLEVVAPARAGARRGRPAVATVSQD